MRSFGENLQQSWRYLFQWTDFYGCIDGRGGLGHAVHRTALLILRDGQ